MQFMRDWTDADPVLRPDGRWHVASVSEWAAIEPNRRFRRHFCVHNHSVYRSMVEQVRQSVAEVLGPEHSTQHNSSAPHSKVLDRQAHDLSHLVIEFL